MFLQLNMLDGPGDRLASHGEPSAVSVLSPFLPRPSAAAMREVACAGAEGKRALSQRLLLSPPSVLTNAALCSPETAARAILWRPGGGACGRPQQSRSLRWRGRARVGH